MIRNNNKQGAYYTVKKLELRIKNKNPLKNHLNNCIYSKKEQVKPVMIMNKQSNINKYSIYLILRKNKKIK